VGFKAKPTYLKKFQSQAQMDLFIELKKQERARSRYWKEKDYFLSQRVKWRAQMARHLFHLFPGESILEIGAGSGDWTEEISALHRNTNPVCAVTFATEYHDKIREKGLPENVEPVLLSSFPGEIEGRRFDFIVGWQLLTDKNCGALLIEAKKLLKPGGQILLFEANPWNPVYNIRHGLAKFIPFFRRKDEGDSINRVNLFTLISEVGFVKINILPYDFLYPPIPRFLLWPMQNLSLIFENFPYLRNFAGALFIWAQNPAPEGWQRTITSLVRHEKFRGKVSVVIPCMNEESNIPVLVKGLQTCYGDYLYEVLVVDDNSSDNTAEVTRALGEQDARIKLVKRTMPNGVGRALRDGLSAAEGDYVLLMDCDFQHILPEIDGLFDAVEKGADVAIGSRFSRNSVLLNYAFTKILSNRGFHIIANLLLGKHFRDATNNLKLMTREVADRIHLEADDFAANAETGLQPILLGYKVEEVPISWINRSVDMGFSSFNLSQTGPNYIFVLARLLVRKWFGKEIVRH
jgi:SAM-dependent methyltransferase